MEPLRDNEQRLIERARSDPAAFQALYERYFSRIYAYVAYRIARVQDAEDVVSEIFIQVVKSLRQFEYRGEGSFAAWLFRIAMLRVKQFYHQQHKPDLQSISFEELPELHSHALSPDNTVLRKEQFIHLYHLIATLSPRRQEIVTLRFFGELANREIAAVLGLDERTVASHLSRALDDLQCKYRAEAEKEAD